MESCRASICWRRRGESFTWTGPEPPPVTWPAPTPADGHERQQRERPSHASVGQDCYSSTGHADRLSKGTKCLQRGGKQRLPVCTQAPTEPSRTCGTSRPAPTEKAKMPAGRGTTSPPPHLLGSLAPGTPGAHIPKTWGCDVLQALRGPISLLQESHHSAPIAVSCSSLPSWGPSAVQERTSCEHPCATGCSASELSTAHEQDLCPSPCSQTKPCPRAMLGALGR